MNLEVLPTCMWQVRSLPFLQDFVNVMRMKMKGMIKI